MRKTCCLITMAFLLIVSTTWGQSISLESVDGLYGPNQIAADGLTPIQFNLRLITDNKVYNGITNGFRVYSEDGAEWGGTVGDTLTSGWAGIGGYFDQFTIKNWSADGLLSDTVGFSGIKLYVGTGLPELYNEVAYSITIGPIDQSQDGKTICLDSAWFPPAGVWIWSVTSTDKVGPAWDGPHCYTIVKKSPVICVDKTSLDFEANVYGALPGDQTITLTNCGFAELDWSIEENLPWLDVVPQSGTGNTQDITVSINTTDMTAQSYTGVLTINSTNASNSPVTIDISYLLNPPFSGNVSLGQIIGNASGDSVGIGNLSFVLNYSVDAQSNYITGITNGYKIYSPDGATWENLSGDTINGFGESVFDQFQISYFGADGIGYDTIGFSGVTQYNPGLPPGYSQEILAINLALQNDDHGKTICIDSSYFPPAGVWKWEVSQGPVNPDWDGPYCFTIDKCLGDTADFDNDGITDNCDECTDTDGDGYGNPGFPNNTCEVDNCPSINNPDNSDSNGDGIGDACTFSAPTNAGNSVYVDISTDVGLIFNTVNTSGETGMTETTEPPSGASPPFTTIPVDNPIYYNLTTTATFDGTINICIYYDPYGLAAGDEASLKLMQFDGTDWNNITTSLDTQANQICGSTSSLSSFSVAFNIGCCEGIRGNTNGDPSDQFDISDIVFLIDYMFNGGPTPPCKEEADVVPNSSIDISDMVFLINYIFNDGIEPPPCP